MTLAANFDHLLSLPAAPWPESIVVVWPDGACIVVPLNLAAVGCVWTDP